MITFNESVLDFIGNIGSNKFFLGIAMLMLNLGSKHISIDFTNTQEKFFKHSFVRKLTLFSVFFIATRDLMVSLILTLLFVFCTQSVLNENSKYSLLKKSDHDYQSHIDYQNAVTIINNFEKNKSDFNFCKLKNSFK